MYDKAWTYMPDGKINSFEFSSISKNKAVCYLKLMENFEIFDFNVDKDKYRHDF